MVNDTIDGDDTTFNGNFFCLKQNDQSKYDHYKGRTLDSC